MIMIHILFRYITRSETAGGPVVKEVDILIYCHEKIFYRINLNTFIMIFIVKVQDCESLQNA
jgi:hypothetical protein